MLADFEQGVDLPLETPCSKSASAPLLKPALWSGVLLWGLLGQGCPAVGTLGRSAARGNGRQRREAGGGRRRRCASQCVAKRTFTGAQQRPGHSHSPPPGFACETSAGNTSSNTTAKQQQRSMAGFVGKLFGKSDGGGMPPPKAAPGSATINAMQVSVTVRGLGRCGAAPGAVAVRKRRVCAPTAADETAPATLRCHRRPPPRGSAPAAAAALQLTAGVTSAPAGQQRRRGGAARARRWRRPLQALNARCKRAHQVPLSICNLHATCIYNIQSLAEREEQLEKKKGLLERRINEEVGKGCCCACILQRLHAELACSR